MDYRNRFYSKYVSSHTKNMYGDQTLERVRSQFRVWQSYFGRFLPENKDAEIIDLGCGSGGFVYWLQQEGFKNVTGIDISKEQVGKAEELGIKNIHLADLRDFLKNKAGVYDLIFARDILEHFSKDEILNLFDLIRFSLKRDGMFVVQTVNAENLLWGRLRHGDFTHEIAFTRESVSLVLRVSGFSNIKIYPQRPVVHGVKSAVRFVLWMVVELLLHFYLLIETGSYKGIFTQNIIVYAKKDEN